MIEDNIEQKANNRYSHLKNNLNLAQVDIAVVHEIILLAIQQNDANDYHEFIKLAYSTHPNNSRNKILEALYLHKNQSDKAAIKVLQAHLQKHPNETDALILIANIRLKQKKIQEAITYYKRIIELNPNNLDIKYNCALAHCEINQVTYAKNLLSEIIITAPDYIKAIGMLGQIALEEKNYQSACDFFSKRLILEQNHSHTWHSLGQAEFMLKQYQESTTSYQNCLYHMPHHPSAHHELATAYIQLGQINEATKHYNLQLEIKPSAETFYNLAVCFMYQEKVNDAIYFFTQALKLEPDTEAAHINLGSLYIKNNNIKQAKIHYQKALIINPSNSEVKHILSALTGTSVSAKAPKEYIESLFNQYAHYYDQHLVKHLDYQAHNLLLKYLDTDDWDNNTLDILDLGCGTGLCGELFKLYAKHFIGIDISTEMINIASNKAIYDRLINDEILNILPSITNQDIILAADVFTYFGELTHLLQQCYASLKQNGKLAFTVESLHQNLPFILQPSIRYAHSHDYIYKTLETAGFINVSINTSVLRHQFKQPVNGYTVTAVKPPIN
jgi:predicted TPR repeat methyltransferase